MREIIKEYGETILSAIGAGVLFASFGAVLMGPLREFLLLFFDRIMMAGGSIG